LARQCEDGLPTAAIFRNRIREFFTVLDRVTPSPAGRIAALVRQLLAKRGITGSIGLDDDLAASGLSSLDTVNLMLAVEAEFGVKIPDADMTPANFRTIARIEALVGGLPQQA
jgi:acyl carrier protein